MNPVLVNGDFLVAILKSGDANAANFALTHMLNTSSYLWTYYIDSVGAIKDAVARHPELASLGAFVLSKLYFYANDHQSALKFALHAENHFDINDRSLYTDTILSLVFSSYTAALAGSTKGEEDHPQENLEQMRVIILKVLETSVAQRVDFDQRIIAGLAIESGNFELLGRLVSSLSNEELSKSFEFAVPTFEGKPAAPAVYQVFLDELMRREVKDSIAISRCLFGLGRDKTHADLLAEIFVSGQRELAFQIASDLNESGSLYYCNQVAQAVQTKLGPASKDLVSILNGDFKRKILQLFLTQNSNVDVPYLKNVLSRWKPKESYFNNAVSMSLATLLASNQSVVHLKDSAKNFASLKNWSLFSVAASLGVINAGRDGFVQEAKELTLNEKSPYCTGGLLYATGLSNFGNTHKEDLRASNLEHLKKKSDEAVQHGAILGLGLQNALSNDEGLIDQMKTILFSEKAVPGEAAGFALNLIKATHYSSEYVEEMINLCQNNPHDKIARATIGTIGLTAINSTADISADYDKMIANKDPHIRLGAVGLLALRHFAAAHAPTINELLRIIATDLSNDVRRLAVIGLALVLIKKRPKAYLLLKMLSTSYNAYIRHAVALSLGLLYAHSFDKKVSKLLLKMLEDKVDYVRQTASIGLGLVFQLGSENLDKEFEQVYNALTERLGRKNETPLAKYGHMVGLALMQPGGENCIINLCRGESWNSSYARPQALIGAFLFTFYWYWYPMGLCLSLALEPTYLIGVNGQLRIPKGFEFYSKTAKKIFDYYKTPENAEQKKNETAPTILSTTKRVQARAGKQGTKGDLDSGDKAMVIESSKPEGEVAGTDNKNEEKKVLLKNPQRILKKQIGFVDLGVENKRYQPVIENRKNGVLFLKDLRPQEEETYADELPKEAWLVPPPEFKFDGAATQTPVQPKK